MTSTEVQESPLSEFWLAQQIDKLNQRVEQVFASLRDLNTSKRSQDAAIADIRQRIDKLNEEVGFDFQGTRIIPRAAAAKLLGRTPRTLQRWEQVKQLRPLYPFPNQTYYRLDDVRALVDSFGDTAARPGTQGK